MELNTVRVVSTESGVNSKGFCNTQNYWILNVVHRPIFRKLKKKTFRTLKLFLEKSNFNQ
jgi:hypothetical protein